MKKMTDRELTDRIRQVFDHYEDPSSPADGWKSLRKKYPAPQRKPLVLWWASAAALLLIAGGTWFSMPGRLNPDQTEISSKPTLSQADQAPGKNKPAVLTEEPSYPEAKPAVRKVTHAIPAVPVISAYDHSADSSPADQPVNKGDQPLLSSVPVQETEVNKPAADPKPDLPGRSASQDPDPADLPQTVQESLVLAGPGRSDGLPGKGNLSDPPAAEDKHRKDQIFSVYAGSFFNYAEGSEMKLNFGAGLTSDVRIGPKLMLTTGISMAQNTLSYKNGRPAAKSEVLRYASPSPSYNPGQSISTVRTVANYDANLLSLDIPVSLKYMIIPKENKLYVSAGLVSGTYLTETYALNYSNYNIASGALINQTKAEEIKKQFQAFDLARTLNLSFGFNTPLSKTQTISVEPFIRYPLGGLGSENLKFGSSGINLRLNFSPLKN